MSKEKLWTRDFVTISLINFLVFLSYFLLMVVIASYAVDRFQASAGEAGLVAGIFIIGALVGRLGAGRIIINTGSKAVLIAGTVLFVITSLSYFLAFNLPALVVIRLINGIAFGIASTATGTIVAQIIPISRHGEGIGF
ncbi:MAG TPA: MFS transporter [Syntrophales bacterium]|nr:MFS transporter [Syntrophales bacterium]